MSSLVGLGVWTTETGFPTEESQKPTVMTCYHSNGRSEELHIGVVPTVLMGFL